MSKFLRTRNGSYININNVIEVTPYKDEKGLNGWSHRALVNFKDQGTHTRELAFGFDENILEERVYVPGNEIAHCLYIDADDGEVYHEQTKVIAWRIGPRFDSWAIPILLNTTDSTSHERSTDFLILIQDINGFEDLGSTRFDTLERAKEHLLEKYKKEKKQ